MNIDTTPDREIFVAACLVADEPAVERLARLAEYESDFDPADVLADMDFFRARAEGIVSALASIDRRDPACVELAGAAVMEWMGRTGSKDIVRAILSRLACSERGPIPAAEAFETVREELRQMSQKNAVWWRAAHQVAFDAAVKLGQ